MSGAGLRHPKRVEGFVPTGVDNLEQLHWPMQSGPLYGGLCCDHWLLRVRQYVAQSVEPCSKEQKGCRRHFAEIDLFMKVEIER